MKSDFLFLARVVTINMVIFLGVFFYLLKDFQVPLSNNTIDSLKQMDVLGVQASSVQSNSTQTDLSFELPRHNIPTDCWIEYSGKFYDITTMLSLDASLPDYCGKDATDLFDSKDHPKSSLSSVDARRMLSQFLIQ